MTTANPTAAAATVNAVVKRYVDVATELKRAKLTELTRLLGEQLDAAASNLKLAETALAGFGSLLGVVLNDTASGGMYGYYYLAGYGTSEENLDEGRDVELEVEDGVVVSRPRMSPTPSAP